MSPMARALTKKTRAPKSEAAARIEVVILAVEAGPSVEISSPAVSRRSAVAAAVSAANFAGPSNLRPQTLDIRNWRPVPNQRSGQAERLRNTAHQTYEISRPCVASAPYKK